MKYQDIIDSKFSEPAALIQYKEGTVKLLECNEKFLPELRMNVSKEDYRIAYPQDCFDSENLKGYLDAIEKCVRSGEEQFVETWREVFSNCCGFDRVCLKSRLVLVESSPDGTIVYEGVRNTTDEKRTLDTLEDIEYRYKNASEQINIYNWEYTIATKEMRPCYRCMRDLGLPALVKNYPDTAIDMGIFPPDYADMYREMMRRIDEGAPQLEADIPLTVGRVPFRVKYTTTFDENGKPIKSFGSATLISETELGRIRLDNQIIEKLAEGYDCMYIADFKDNTVKTVKQDSLFSLPVDADATDLAVMVAKKLQEINGDQTCQLCDVEMLRREMFADSDKREFVYRNETDGRWVRIEYLVVDRGEEEVDRLLITASVVDDFRAQKMNADRLIAAQKEELLDRQTMLLEAIDVANKANNAKTEFFSNMSHDIRTPMNAITGFSRLAMEEIHNTAQVKDYLGKISSAGEHLMSLINDILDMSLIESGKMEIHESPAVLKDLLLECADMVRMKMDENKLRFVVDTEAMGEDVVMCDTLRFHQVLLNLLSNAYKYTPEGGSVFLEARLVEKKDLLTYEFRVRDTGIGMSKEFCEHIWDAFSREETDIVRHTQGTGLGMVIVRNIVNLMQGTIDLVSEPGQGSEFIIALPFKPSEITPAKSEKDQATEDAMHKSYEGITLLVVDDTDMNLTLAKRILGKFGFTVKVSESGVEALKLLEDPDFDRIDLILMDVMMPVMDGLETTKRIRAMEDPHLANIPIIALTANAFESDVKKALDAGMDDYIAKPYRQEDIIPLIHANLKEAP